MDAELRETARAQAARPRNIDEAMLTKPKDFE
jgi:hypothetical protein